MWYYSICDFITVTNLPVIFYCSPAPSTSTTEPTTKSEEKVIDDARVCQICFQEERGVLFLPCGHLVACVKCAPSLSTCAVCRQPFSGTVRAFLSWTSSENSS